LTLKNTGISGYSKAGIDLTGNEKLVIDGGTIRLNGIGINVTADSTHRPTVAITGVSVNANQVGIHIDSAFFPSLPPKLRKNIVTGNKTGIQVGRPAEGGCFLACADLGTADDAGNNTIMSNTITGVFLDVDAGVPAVGNTWNPNTQAANPSGTYPANFLVTGDRSDALARGKNFFLNGGSTTSIQL
jgi:hypothetical protein